MRFTGMTAVVTGAAQGIGFAAARQLAAGGAQVVIADRAADPAREAARRIEAEGGRALAMICDLEQREGAVTLFDAVLRDFGRIDVSVHNVGGAIWVKPFWEFRPDEVETEIRRSLWPTLWCCHVVLPHMLAAGAGAIVNIGSVATRGINRGPYAAAKGGVAALTSALALDIGERGVRINCVAPGGTDVGPRATARNPAPPTEADLEWMRQAQEQTEHHTPLRRMGLADEMAAAVCFFASPEASYITGQTLYVAGGGIG